MTRTCTWVFLIAFALPAYEPAPHLHPFLFLTQADVSRARQGRAAEPAIDILAQSLIAAARTNSIEQLPHLERAWWDVAKQKPWNETYPEIFHHTFIVPHKWADLARHCARASLLASEDAFREKGKELLLKLADYSFEFEHYDVGMNYTLWGVTALEAYDILYDHFTASERDRMDACFARLGAAVDRNDEYWVRHEPGGKLNNHYAWHKLCQAMLGLFYNQPARVEQAWHGPKGIQFLMEQGFKDNGLWLEGAPSYQFAATAPFLLLAQLLKNVGSDYNLFAFESSAGFSLKGSYDALVPLLFPDRTLPGLGDAYARRPHLGIHGDWEVLFRHFHDPVYAWLLNDSRARPAQALFQGIPQLPPSPPPTQSSCLWLEMGYAALRTSEGTNYWAGHGWTVFATWSGQPVHEHADKLSLILYGNGHLWLPDCETKSSAEHAFSSRVQKELNRETLGHNTVLVGGRSQRFSGRRLDLLECASLPTVKRLSMGDLSGQLYPGVRQLRTIIARPEYVLDVFELAATNETEFAWMIHVDGEPSDSSVTNLMPTQLPPDRPWNYLRSPRLQSVSGQIWESFSHGTNRFHYDLLASTPVEVITCGFPKQDSSSSDTWTMRLVRCRAKTVQFLALYRSGTSRHERVRLQLEPGELGKWRARLSFPSSQETVHHVPRLESLL